MKNSILFAFVFALFYLASCCDKREGLTTIELQAQVCFTVQHHSLIIPEAEVYIKLNGGDTLKWDGSKYDRKITTNTTAKGCFTKLPLGTHWLMATGYDADIRLDVIGRQPIKITKIDEQQDIVMAVSER
jgi:hypothetical protein